MLRATALLLLVLTVFADGRVAQAASGGIEWIDAHMHVIGGRVRPDFEGAVQAAADALVGAGIRRAIIMPPPQMGPDAFSYTAFAAAVKERAAHMSMLGGGGTLNPLLHEAPREGAPPEALLRRFEETARGILADGALGFGEIAVHHLSLQPQHPYESVPADHPLLLKLADIAAEHDVVIDLHMDPVTEPTPAPPWLQTPPNPPSFTPNIEAFERLLAHNRGARVVWAHAGSDMLGQWTVELSRTLLTKHPNLYMSLRMGPGRAPFNHPLTPAGTIKPGWRALLQEFPDRFVIGSDSFFLGAQVRGGPASVYAKGTARNRARTRQFLAALPKPLARAIAYQNAKRIYRIPE